MTREKRSRERKKRIYDLIHFSPIEDFLLIECKLCKFFATECNYGNSNFFFTSSHNINRSIRFVLSVQLTEVLRQTQSDVCYYLLLFFFSLLLSMYTMWNDVAVCVGVVRARGYMHAYIRNPCNCISVFV